MTKSVEVIAGMYRQHGWEKQARELEADAERFRADGVPEYFESGMQEEGKQEPVQALKRQLVEILAAEKIDPQKSKNETYLTPALAARINQVGRKFDDSTHLSELAVKGRGTYVEFHVPGEPVTGEDQAYEIDARLVNSFNRLLNRPLRFGLKTIGQVRDSSPYELFGRFYPRLVHRTNPLIIVGEKPTEQVQRVQFLKNALARTPQAKSLTTGK